MLEVTQTCHRVSTTSGVFTGENHQESAGSAVATRLVYFGREKYLSPSTVSSKAISRRALTSPCATKRKLEQSTLAWLTHHWSDRGTFLRISKWNYCFFDHLEGSVAKKDLVFELYAKFWVDLASLFLKKETIEAEFNQNVPWCSFSGGGISKIARFFYAF